MKNNMIFIAMIVVSGLVLFGWFLYRFGNVPEPDWNENIPKNPMEDNGMGKIPESTPSKTSDVREDVGPGYNAE